MSVDLVNAQMAEAWQVQQKRWQPQLRQEGTRDEQSSEVLRNQNMLHIMSENEKCLSYSLGVNQFTDSTQEECESTYFGYKLQNVSKLVNTLGRFHYDGGVLDLPSDWNWSESSAEVITPMKNQGQCGSCCAFSMTGALEWVMDGLRRCLSTRSLIVTHGVQGVKVERRDSSVCSVVAT